MKHLLFSIILIFPLVAQSQVFTKGQQQVGFAAGVGQGSSINDDRDTRNVSFIFVSPHWGVNLTDPIGKSFYKGNLALLVEVQHLFNSQPRPGYSVGVATLLRYHFLQTSRFVPFLEVGVGAAYVDFGLQDQADGLNFLPQGGIGFHLFLSERVALTAAGRLHHISNAGLRSPNPGINSWLGVVGITVFPKW